MSATAAPAAARQIVAAWHRVECVIAVAAFGFIAVEGNLVADVDLHSYVVGKSKAGLPSRTIVNYLRLDRGIDTTPKTVCKFLRENVR